jgi:hypothetical protein
MIRTTSHSNISPSEGLQLRGMLLTINTTTRIVAIDGSGRICVSEVARDNYKPEQVIRKISILTTMKMKMKMKIIVDSNDEEQIRLFFTSLFVKEADIKQLIRTDHIMIRYVT